MRAKALYKNAKNELLVLEPSKKNISMHNEYLEITEEISSKEVINENNAKLLEKLREDLYEIQKKFQENNIIIIIIFQMIKKIKYCFNYKFEL